MIVEKSSSQEASNQCRRQASHSAQTHPVPNQGTEGTKRKHLEALPCLKTQLQSCLEVALTLEEQCTKVYVTAQSTSLVHFLEEQTPTLHNNLPLRSLIWNLQPVASGHSHQQQSLLQGQWTPWQTNQIHLNPLRQQVAAASTLPVSP